MLIGNCQLDPSTYAKCYGLSISAFSFNTKLFINVNVYLVSSASYISVGGSAAVRRYGIQKTGSTNAFALVKNGDGS